MTGGVGMPGAMRVCKDFQSHCTHLRQLHLGCLPPPGIVVPGHRCGWGICRRFLASLPARGLCCGLGHLRGCADVGSSPSSAATPP